MKISFNDRPTYLSADLSFTPNMSIFFVRQLPLELTEGNTTKTRQM